MDVTPSGGVKIQKVGAIYTRTLEEGGAIYVENGVVIHSHTVLLILPKKFVIFRPPHAEESNKTHTENGGCQKIGYAMASHG